MAMRQTLVRLTHRDFFGIHDITSKDISAAFANLIKLDADARNRKYDALLGARTRLVSEQQEKPTDFGAVRYDKENVVRKHGQYEENNIEPLYDTVQVKQMFVPDGDSSPSLQKLSDGTTLVHNSEKTEQIGNAPYKISEVQAIKELDEVLQLFKAPGHKMVLKYANKPPLTYLFDGIVEDPEDCSDRPKPAVVSRVASSKEDPPPKSSPQAASSDKSAEVVLRRPQMEYDKLAGPDGLTVPLHELDPTSEEYIDYQYEQNKVEMFDRKIDAQFDAPEKPTEPLKAMDYLKKVRSQAVKPVDQKLKRQLENAEHPYSFQPQIKLDSKGFNIYKYQVPDWNAVRRVDAVNYIKSCIAYHNYDILAINKPYGIVSHENPDGQEPFDMNSLVAEVAKSMRIPKVHLVHRLDKTTTGILLFATSEKRARDLHQKFKKGEIKKLYWCITRGVPDPPKGVLDIPIGEYRIAGKLRSVPVPEGFEDDKQLATKFREARRAVTEYEILDSTRHMALVQCRPLTGVKHQIRCHLGFGLKTPIFGDHKYSFLNKLAPQQLPDKVLDAFRLRQSKVRSLPMHLHAKSIVIPSAKANDGTLFITANLPRHFQDNLRTLKLRAELPK